ncbi:MAG: hypothetical protein AAF554_08910 [Bacteroidota bacterium]
MNKSLLTKYYNNSCTDVEKKAVEAWLKADDLDESLSISTKEKIEIKEEIWESIRSKNNLKTGRVLRLIRKSLKVAAAACIIFASFLGGRVSANVNAPTINSPTKLNEHLYIYSGKKSYGNLPGELFKVQFDGRLRFYNASKKTQKLMVGDSVFTLHPKQNYYLIGNTESAELTTGRNEILGTYGSNDLSAGFAILRIHR